MEYLTEPLSHGFLVRGLLGGLLVALPCAVLSVFVVWRRMSFMGDALSHSVLPGIVLAYVVGISLFWGALAAALLAALGIGFISRRGHLNEDAAIGVIFAGFFALGLLLLNRVVTFADLKHILFGNILSVSSKDLLMMSAVTLVVLLLSLFSMKEIVTASFDPSHAQAIGLSPELVRHLLLILLALTIVAATQTVGVVLVLALMVTPGAAASLVARSLGRIMLVSILLSILATFCGFYISYYGDFSSGPAIVLSLTLMFFACGLVGLIRRHRL